MIQFSESVEWSSVTSFTVCLNKTINLHKPFASRCPNMAVQAAEEDDILDDNKEVPETKTTSKKDKKETDSKSSVHKFKKQKVRS